MIGDPLLLDVDWVAVGIVALKAVLAFVLLLLIVIFMVWFERKAIARLQNRIGPNIAGPFGVLQTLADGMKLLFKEDLMPDRADRLVFRLAPYLTLVPAFLTFAIIPIGGRFDEGRDGTVSIFGRDTLLQVADPPVGILFFLAMSSIAVYGIMLAGWSSGSKYPLLGSVRATAQMVSYEAALGLSLASVLLVSGSLSTNSIVGVQAGEGFWGVVPNWNVIVTGLVPFVVFLIAGSAELNRAPFDLVEAEQELVGGFHTEYSSFRFAMFYLGEYVNLVNMSAIFVTLFFGGPSGPILIDAIAPVWPVFWFFLKLLVFLFVFVWIRATLPRFRYDQLMDLGWKVLIPLSLGWLMLLAAIRIARDGNIGLLDSADADVVAVVGISAVVLVGGAALLSAAINAGRKEREAAQEGLLPFRGPVNPLEDGR